MRSYAVILLLLLAGCRPCRQPNLCLPEQYIEGECVDACGGEPVDLNQWWAQFHDPLLSEMIERALCCNHDLRIARERICEARGLFRVDVSILAPQLEGTLGWERNRNSQTLAQSPFVGGTFINHYVAGFDAFWEIDLFGKNIDRARAACLEVGAAAAEVRDVHVSVASEVARYYAMLRALQNRIDVALDHIENEKELVALTEERFRTGIAPGLDIANAQALLAERQSQLPQFEAELKAVIYRLAVLLGQDPETLAYLYCAERQPIPSTCGMIPLGLPSELLCQRGDVRSAELAMLAAGARVMAAKKEFFPTINIFGMFHWATGFYTQWFKSASRHWQMHPVGTLPILTGGRILANIDVETSLQRQAALAYERSVLVALEEVESGLAAYFKEAVRYEALEREISALEEARELSMILYKKGLVDFLNVIDVERDLFTAQNRFISSKEQLMTLLVAVYKALGGGWEC